MVRGSQLGDGGVVDGTGNSNRIRTEGPTMTTAPMSSTDATPAPLENANAAEPSPMGRLPVPLLTLPLLLLAPFLLAALAKYVIPPNLGKKKSAALLREGVTSAPDFNLVERSGKPMTRDDLKNRVWVAGFIFTRCPGVCPTVTGAMAELRAQISRDVALVTFTVDPDNDTPEVLSEYAKKMLADHPNWYFVTGPRNQMYDVIRRGFLLGVEKNTDPKATEPITHSSRLALVDRKGQIRSYHDALDPAAMANLRHAIRRLEAEAP